jgi:hypothetical protein
MADTPSSFLCPITHELMTDPVIDPDGNSFERSAIENWLKEHSTSPIVNLLPKKQNILNNFLSRLVLLSV